MKERKLQRTGKFSGHDIREMPYFVGNSQFWEKFKLFFLISSKGGFYAFLTILVLFQELKTPNSENQDHCLDNSGNPPKNLKNLQDLSFQSSLIFCGFWVRLFLYLNFMHEDKHRKKNQRQILEKKFSIFWLKKFVHLKKLIFWHFFFFFLRESSENLNDSSYTWLSKKKLSYLFSLISLICFSFLIFLKPSFKKLQSMKVK